ncbi:hypothetical protein CC80DRAFT_509497 [Byssothecium circinans]|uniref:Cora-domain-containing protein n=1 Tax=Byssothecium circinans TaxID=147558 RepID=A0A6A5TP76_9PLEO|nr:hypothetical protein CC80DRAFT_509497 [Byssothecium circinans]
MASKEATSHPLSYLTKQRSPLFLEIQNPNDTLFLDWLRMQDGYREGLELRAFFKYDQEAPMRQVEDVMRFYQNSESPYSDRSAKRCAWLDDREFRPTDGKDSDAQCFRKYDLPMTAATLYGHLKRECIDLEFGYVSISIRIILRRLLIPLASNTNIERCNVEARCTPNIIESEDNSYRVFEMEFNVPSYALRAYAPPPMEAKNTTARVRHDLSFLVNSFPGAQQQGNLYLTDKKRWTAHCFEDTAYDLDRELDKDAFDHHGLNTDPFAWVELLYANYPIWNPREYFVSVVRLRIGQVRNEWSSLIRVLENIVHGYTEDDLSGSFTPKSKQHIERCFAEINEKFQDLQDIKKRLEDLEKRLEALEQQCQTLAQVLQLRLALETSKSAEVDGFISWTMVLAVSPVAIVSAFCAIPQPMFYFERNTTSFVIVTAAITVMPQCMLVLARTRLRQRPWWRWATAHAHNIPGHVARFPMFLSKWYNVHVFQTRDRPTPLLWV